jgi:hypothetical protein
VKKADIKAEINARFDAACEAVAATLAGHQLALAGQFLESELRSHGSVKAIPDQAAVRVLGPAFVQGAARFPTAAREMARRMGKGGTGSDIVALGDRIASVRESPVLISNIGDLEILPPDGGNGSVDPGGDIPPPPPPPPNTTEPEPTVPAVVEPAIPFDQLPQEARDQAQAQWNAHVGPEAQFAIDAAAAFRSVTCRARLPPSRWGRPHRSVASEALPSPRLPGYSSPGCSRSSKTGWSATRWSMAGFESDVGR